MSESASEVGDYAAYWARSVLYQGFRTQRSPTWDYFPHYSKPLLLFWLSDRVDPYPNSSRQKMQRCCHQWSVPAKPKVFAHIKTMQWGKKTNPHLDELKYCNFVTKFPFTLCRENTSAGTVPQTVDSLLMPPYWHYENRSRCTVQLRQDNNERLEEK